MPNDGQEGAAITLQANSRVSAIWSVFWRNGAL